MEAGKAYAQVKGFQSGHLPCEFFAIQSKLANHKRNRPYKILENSINIYRSQTSRWHCEVRSIRVERRRFLCRVRRRKCSFKFGVRKAFIVGRKPHQVSRIDRRQHSMSQRLCRICKVDGKIDHYLWFRRLYQILGLQWDKRRWVWLTF